MTTGSATALDLQRRASRMTALSCLFWGLLGCGENKEGVEGELAGKGAGSSRGGTLGSGGTLSGSTGGKSSAVSGGSSGSNAGTPSGGASMGGVSFGGKAMSGSTSTGGGTTGGNASLGGGTSAAGGTSGGPSVSGCRIFPPDNAWNRDVSGLPVHARSQAFIDSIGATAHVHPDFGTVWEGAPIGIPYVSVDATQAKLAVEFTAYGDESDHDPYPIPPGAPIEGGPNGDGDRHVIVVETSSCRLFELYRAFPVPGGNGWRADSGAIYDLSSNAPRPLGWTSADAAGLPIFPGLVRYDEVVEKRAIEHALRFTVARSQAAIVAPARHFASSSTDPNLPPMGLRLRMRAAYDVSTYSDEAKVVCAALKRFGMIVADNGSNWYISGAPDPRWNDDALADLKKIPGSAFEVVDTGPIETY